MRRAMSITQTDTPLTQDELARTIAADIAPGSCLLYTSDAADEL